jgi:hypothetical protein
MVTSDWSDFLAVDWLMMEHIPIRNFFLSIQKATLHFIQACDWLYRGCIILFFPFFSSFFSFCCALLSLKRDDLVKVLTNPDTEDVDMSFQEQSMNVLTNPDTEDMEMCFPEHLSFHLGGNLYLIAEQDGILLTDKNTMSDIYFPLVRWVQLQTTWGYIDDAIRYLEHNRYTSLDVHLGANVFVTAESPALHLHIRHYYWMNDKRHPSSHGVSLDFDHYQKLKDVDRMLPDIFSDFKKTLPCQLTHQNVDSTVYCSECNPCCI